MQFDLVIKGDLVLPEGVRGNGWAAVRNGVIAALGQGEAPDAAETIDHSGHPVFPGVVDGQTYCRLDPRLCRS